LQTRRKLKPGQPGTKKLLQKYGDELVCVRYRYDLQRKKRIKTVELIVEEGPWEQNPAKTPPNKIIYVRVNYDETYLRRLVGAAGGRWNRIRKLWELPYRAVVELGLGDRVVDQIKKSV
jgi:hypothetical protein